MYILAIETTGPKGSVAVIDGEGNICLKTSAEKMNHLKDLMPMAQQIIDELGISKADLSAAAASIGPGSFTGIRIGVASARAVAQALQIPAVAVPTLDAFKSKCSGLSLIVPIFNARRGQVYGAVFDEDGGDILKSGPYMLTDCFDALRKHFADRRDNLPCGMPETVTVTFYGDGIDAYREELDTFAKTAAQTYTGARVLFAEEEERYQRADMIALCALEKYRAGQTLAAEKLLPDYMRATEAEQKLKDGSLAKERAAKMARFKAR